ncbi:ABC transporter ATP-binding protein (plasmid) [Haladaptatus sp. SPP-AMP-3]|uniref:ABC transporter ATP-binding protein n=1 Tax=Haladaptatus sp. SPP-AMP-3 TaxID=3121295 RepID=UPI003C2FF1AE
MTTAIEAKDIDKSFDGNDVLESVSVDVEEGEVLVLLGPNGVGKTVLLSCMAGSMRPTDGSVLVFGKPPQAASNVGFLLQEAMGIDSLTGRENIRFYSRLHPRFTDRWEKYVERFDVVDALDKPLEDCSVGMKRKIELAITLSIDVPVYLLDEPTAGLDLSMIQTLHGVVRERDATFVISSHLPHDADLADRLAFVNDGRVVATGTPKEMLSSLPPRGARDGYRDGEHPLRARRRRARVQRRGTDTRIRPGRAERRGDSEANGGGYGRRGGNRGDADLHRPVQLLRPPLGGRAMTETETQTVDDVPDDVDVTRLKRDIEGIKDAMGIEERYPSLVRLWLVFAALVLVASLASQYVLSERLPAYWFGVVWFGLMATGGVVSWYLGRHERGGPPRELPNVGYQFGLIFCAGLVIQLVTNPVLGDLGYVDGTLYVFSIWTSLTGIGYLVEANSLRAYRIRRKDRLALSVGGVLMVAYVLLLSYWEPLRPWGYAAFGVSYFIYAVAAYGILRGA